MKKTQKKLAYTLLISIIILLPSTSALARRKNEVLITIPGGSLLYWNEELMPNGFLKVEIGLQFTWAYDNKIVGTADQHVTGIIRTDGIAMLKGYGIYTSNVPGLPGTITYTIGNNWDMDATVVEDEIWAFRMLITGGTESFEGIKGTGSDDAYPNFLLYLNFDPWET